MKKCAILGVNCSGKSIFKELYDMKYILETDWHAFEHNKLNFVMLNRLHEGANFLFPYQYFSNLNYDDLEIFVLKPHPNHLIAFYFKMFYIHLERCIRDNETVYLDKLIRMKGFFFLKINLSTYYIALKCLEKKNVKYEYVDIFGIEAGSSITCETFSKHFDKFGIEKYNNSLIKEEEWSEEEYIHNFRLLTRNYDFDIDLAVEEAKDEIKRVLRSFNENIQCNKSNY